MVLGLAATVAADPKPAPVDVKPLKDKLTVLADAQGGVYAVFHDPDSPTSSVLFYGTAKSKTLYAQIITGGGRDGDAWHMRTWAPRLPDMHDGYLYRHQDGSFERDCAANDEAVLGELTGDKARAVLDGYAFLSSAIVRRPHLLARDDAGTYYYVDEIAKDYGGNGQRVFIGKRGAMRQVPLTDIASDSGGEVYSTKTGEIRLVTEITTTADNTSTSHHRVSFVRGDKKIELVWLDLEMNSRLIFKDLAVYDFLGTLCESG